MHALRSYWHYAAILLVLILVASIRFRLRDFPLERDEGEYAYMGQLILQGIPPYKLAYNMKLPGTYAAYAVILALFGQTPAGIHCGLLLVNAATTILMYILGARLFGRSGGITAGACYALLSTGQAVLGTAAHATHFVIIFALAGVLSLLNALEKDRHWLLLPSGALFGMAFLMKQPGIFFLFFACLYLLSDQWRRRPLDWPGLAKKAAILCLGAVAPFALTCLVMYATGVFDKFWFWTFGYAREYASTLTITEGIQQFGITFSKIVTPTALVWLIAAVGLPAAFWNTRFRVWKVFTAEFVLFSAVAICPGLYFRPHYFILLLPAVALLAGLAVSSWCVIIDPARRSLRLVPPLVLVAALAYSVYQQRNYFFIASPAAACRQTYGYSPFEESLEIADYLKSHTSRNDRIAVLGSEPQIYFYADRHSATGYLYTYALLEAQPYALQMQREMIGEIEKARPAYLIFVNVATSWIPQKANAEPLIFGWFADYAARNYVLEGVVDVAGWGSDKYRWGPDAKPYLAYWPTNVTIFRRTASGQR